MLGVFAGFGLGLTATRHVAQYREVEPARAGRIIALTLLTAALSGILLAVFLTITAPFMAAHTLAAPELTNALRIATLILLLSAIAGAQQGVLAGFEDFGAIARVNLYRGLAAFPVSVLAVILWGLRGAVWGLVFSPAIGVLLNVRAIHQAAARTHVIIAYSQAARELPVLWSFSFPALITNALAGSAAWLANTILVRQTHGYAQMGILTASNQVSLAIGFLPTLLLNATLPVLSNEQRHGIAGPGYHRALETTQRLTTLWTLPIATALAVFGEQILSVFGPAFRGAYPVLLGLVAGVMVSTLGGPIGSGIAACGRMWQGAMFNGLWSVVLTGGTWLLVPHLGALGYAAAFACAHVVLALGGLTVLWRELPARVIRRLIAGLVHLVALAVICLCVRPPMRTILAVMLLAAAMLPLLDFRSPGGGSVREAGLPECEVDTAVSMAQAP
jgi:O-antigen/teichoic acid export membrane protein